jgi:hypothetical protein
MKTRYVLLPLALLAAAGATAVSSVKAPLAAAPTPVLTATPVTGEYVEARTAAVFAGACHYNGELVTTGQDALLAWHVTSGSFEGIDLSGLRAMAAVTSPENLSHEHASRKTELLIDSSASAAQVKAFTDLLHSKASAQLGDIAAVRRGPIAFTHNDAGYTVSAEGYGTLDVHPMPNGECCKQPNLVWYSPILPLEGRKVGYTEAAAYTAGTVGDPWQRGDENSAFYGTCSF